MLFANCLVSLSLCLSVCFYVSVFVRLSLNPLPADARCPEGSLDLNRMRPRKTKVFVAALTGGGWVELEGMWGPIHRQDSRV